MHYIKHLLIRFYQQKNHIQISNSLHDQPENLGGLQKPPT